MKLIKNTYLKSIGIILTGGAAAQLIALLSLPILSRLYTPENFGLYASYIALISILTIIATLRFDFAIQIAKSNKEIDILKTIIIISTFIVACIIFSALFINNLKSIGYFNNLLSNVSKSLIILTLFSTTIITFSISESIWHKRFIEISKVRVFQSLLLSILCFVFSFYDELGLIYSYIIANVIAASYFVVKKRFVFIKYRARLKLIFGKYSKFPKYSVPSDIFNSFSNIAMPLIITFAFSPKIAGLYFMAEKIVKSPLGVLYQSISSVYTEKAGKLYNNKEIKDLISLTNYTQTKISLVLAPLLVIASIIAPYLFETLFGEDWVTAGELVKYFSIFVFFNGLYSPISQIGNILGLQRYLLYFNFSLAVFMTLPFIIHNDMQFKYVLLVSSLIGALHFILLNVFMQIKLREI